LKRRGFIFHLPVLSQSKFDGRLGVHLRDYLGPNLPHHARHPSSGIHLHTPLVIPDSRNLGSIFIPSVMPDIFNRASILFPSFPPVVSSNPFFFLNPSTKHDFEWTMIAKSGRHGLS